MNKVNLISKIELRRIVTKHGGPEQFAPLIGVKVRTLYYWLSGKRPVREPMVKLIRQIDKAKKGQR